MKDEQQEEAFKVVDKRRFTESGEAKEAGEEPKQVEQPKASPENSSEGDIPGPEGMGDLNFSTFVMSLATQTMVMLGEIPHPETNLITANLDAAKQTIDILAILENKTAGNLDANEEQLLHEILSTLRLAYVKKANG